MGKDSKGKKFQILMPAKPKAKPAQPSFAKDNSLNSPLDEPPIDSMISLYMSTMRYHMEQCKIPIQKKNEKLIAILSSSTVVKTRKFDIEIKDILNDLQGIKRFKINSDFCITLQTSSQLFVLSIRHLESLWDIDPSLAYASDGECTLKTEKDKFLYISLINPNHEKAILDRCCDE